jgi:hypothetical protein
MNRLAILALASASLLPGLGAARQASGRVTIIESQVNNTAYDMDAEWLAVATSMGYLATIQTQAALDSTDFFATTDILIVSSGTLSISPIAVANLEAFLGQGGQVYLQGEYLSYFSTNQAFSSIVNKSGAYFSFSGSQSGDLKPMAISGPISQTPNDIPTLDRHWNGAYAYASSAVTPFMHYSGRAFGWMYQVPGGGKIVHTTDQDWIKESANPRLQENILAYLTVDEFRLTLSPGPLQSGAPATLIAHQATPFGRVLAAYSLTGAGPSNTIYGPVDLSLPIQTMPTMTADAAGMATHTRIVPNSIGMTVWIQAVDIASGQISNLLTVVIQ